MSLLVKSPPILTRVDFFSLTAEEIFISNSAVDKLLPSVDVENLPDGVTVVRAVGLLFFRAIENTNASANKLNGLQYINVRKSPSGTWRSAISLLDDLFGVAGSTREGGHLVIGNYNVARQNGWVEVDGNATYDFQWAASLADLAELHFNEFQTGLRLWYKA